tara:strand:- start:326 stop:514 length:189 start_codon:yes stop_codon:yes gene_type:complete
MSSNADLQKTINSSVVDVLDQMKQVSGDDRYHLAMEFCEWIFWDETERDDQLIVPDLSHLVD